MCASCKKGSCSSMNLYTILKLKKYFDKLLSGKLRLRSQWNPIDEKYSFFVNRLILKFHNCKSLIGFFDENFDGEIVYYTRHPIPTSLSIIDKKWDTQIRPYLKDQNYINKYLNGEIVEKTKDVLNNGSNLEKFATEWCIENVAPLEQAKKNNNWTLFTFEELVMEKERTIHKMALELNLDDVGGMKKTARLPSKTATKKSKKNISEKNSNYLAKRWVRRVNKKEIKRVEKIMDVFGIDIYKADDVRPSSRFSSLSNFGY